MILLVLCILILLIFVAVSYYIYTSSRSTSSRVYGQLYRMNNLNNTTPFLVRCNENLVGLPREVLSAGLSEGVTVRSPGFEILTNGVYQLQVIMSMSSLEENEIVEITFFQNEAIGSMSSTTLRNEVNNITLIGLVAAKKGDFIEVRMRSKKEIHVSINYIILSISSM
jgi:hypothetical protein